MARSTERNKRKGEVPIAAEPRPLSIDIREAEDYAVITPQGYLNALTGDRIDKECETLIARGARYIVINFGSVETINTIGISILVGIIEKVLQHRGIVYFTQLNGTSREIFEVLNLNTVAMIFADDASALEHIQRDRNSLRRAMDA